MPEQDATARRLRARVRRLMDGEPEDFDALALELWRWQVAHNPDYRAVSGDARPRTWRELPAVPVALFRSLPLTSFPAGEAQVVFRTSGTTGAQGVVRLRDTALYDHGARAHAEAIAGPVPPTGVSLVPHAPDSSLGHMCQQFCPGLVPCFTPDGTDVDRAWAALAEGAAAGRPLFVPGTAFAFAALLAEEREPVELPEGSLTMITGGFKGRRVALSADELRERLRRMLPGARHVEEYGMSELSSQLWAPRHGAPFVPPPWLRVQAVDPRTGAPAAVGLLRFVDLASMDTVVCIETRDLGEVLPDGSVVLHGRLPGAPARGCSLSVEEATRDVSQLAAQAPQDSAPPRAPGALLPGDSERIERVLALRDALLRLDPTPFSEGLGPAHARVGWEAALGAITAEGLESELRTPGDRPRTVLLVAARGVFTAPLEWVVLALAAGAAVRWKAPTGAEALPAAVADAAQALDLPLEVHQGRSPGTPDAVIAFGSDQTVAALAAATPGARHALYGHRFSLGAVSETCEDDVLEGISRDAALYASRGCMAPAAVLVEGDPALLGPRLAAVHDQTLAALPGPPLPAAHGPEWRRRIALARRRGGVWTHGQATVVALDPADLTPTPLPGMIVLHGVRDGDHARALLAPWLPWLSSLALDPALRSGGWTALAAAAHRSCAPGTLQVPPFPRRHDGRPMLGSILGA